MSEDAIEFFPEDEDILALQVCIIFHAFFCFKIICIVYVVRPPPQHTTIQWLRRDAPPQGSPLRVSADEMECFVTCQRRWTKH